MNRPDSITEHQFERLCICIHRFISIDSTNAYLKRVVQPLIRLGAPFEGLAALADAQTEGRGRMGRDWYSPAAEGLYFSVLLKPTLDPARLSALTLACAVAVYETLHSYIVDGLDIKWPNDLLVHDKKVCGILCEAGFEQEALAYALVGIGVNLNQISFPDGLAATSIRMVTGKLVDREEFLQKLLHSIDLWYGRLECDLSAILQAWSDRSSYVKGREILFQHNSTTVSGIISGLEASGGLRVELGDGSSMTLYGGEILLKRGA